MAGQSNLVKQMIEEDLPDVLKEHEGFYDDGVELPMPTIYQSRRSGYDDLPVLVVVPTANLNDTSSGGHRLRRVNHRIVLEYEAYKTNDYFKDAGDYTISQIQRTTHAIDTLVSENRRRDNDWAHMEMLGIVISPIGTVGSVSRAGALIDFYTTVSGV